MLAFLLGLQGGYTKYTFFVCLWDSWPDDQHFIRCEWLLREHFQLSLHKVIIPNTCSEDLTTTPSH